VKLTYSNPLFVGLLLALASSVPGNPELVSRTWTVMGEVAPPLLSR
jgi:hypothetical protein